MQQYNKVKRKINTSYMMKTGIIGTAQIPMTTIKKFRFRNPSGNPPILAQKRSAPTPKNLDLCLVRIEYTSCQTIMIDIPVRKPNKAWHVL
ncbi:hypothetical protein SCAR479_06489 [Seiridium cardinale]|uniref:Uncharacterized protein n=1 Tax=Seiridium cardinale TaxID=138064 RepID=A0ABR2XSF9_9PEZI